MMSRTKVVATIGPASSSPEMIRDLIRAGMDVARINFSHGKYEDHAAVISLLREISEELQTPVTILQDLQGPKIRVAQLPEGETELIPGDIVTLVPENSYTGQRNFVPIDYPYVAEEAKPGMQVLLADGLFELEVTEIKCDEVCCKVLEGGILKSRKGVNFPQLNLRLPSLTDKDRKDLEFGLSQDVDWISLSFVREAADVKILKELIKEKGTAKPVIAKIEKPQAVEHLEEIIDASDGIMVARGDLGVEMNPESVPMIQKRIIELCNRKGKPVITATQMLESMIHEPRPTRAEASDVANAIVDGTDAIMLSGETAMGEFPVKAIEMMERIARDVESKIEFKTYPHLKRNDIIALSQAANVIERVVDLSYIIVLTTSGRSARYVAAERPKTPVLALTTHATVYHMLNLLWGVRPILVKEHPETFEDVSAFVESILAEKGLILPGQKVLIMAGIPTDKAGGTNYLKIHLVK
ncbi:MAG: pyruvate kinase [Bacteroidetes bacterium]|nr:pyruvate kinase [Bacteroidota bacterium]